VWNNSESIITGHFPFSRYEGFSQAIIVTVVVEVVITLMMQQMCAYMLPGAAESLGKHLPQANVFCRTALDRQRTFCCFTAVALQGLEK
jgi:hypothetical protein